MNLSPEARSFDLTPAEHRLYLLIVEGGLRDREISTKTGFTYGSVKTIIHRILEKKGCSGRVELVVKHWKAMKF